MPSRTIRSADCLRYPGQKRFGAVAIGGGLSLLVWCCVVGAAAGPAPAGNGEASAEEAKKLVELVGDITENMELIEEMLKQKDSGPATQGKQQGIVKQLDELVEELKKHQCESSGGGGGGEQQKQEKSQEDQKAEQRRRQMEQMGGRQPKGGKKSGKKQGGKGKEKSGAKKEPGGEKEQPGKVPNVKKGFEKGKESSVAGPLTEKKQYGGWGFLPGEIRALLKGNVNEGPPPRYAELLRRYFERLSQENAAP